MRPDRDWMQSIARVLRLCEYQRTLAICKPGWSASRCIRWRASMSLNIAAVSASVAMRAIPDLFQPYWRLPDGVSRRERSHHHAGFAGHRLRGKIDLYAEMKALAA